MEIVGEVVEMVPLIGKVLNKLANIAVAVENAIEDKKDAKIVFKDLKTRINQAQMVLEVLKLESEDALCARPLLRTTVEDLQGHTDEAIGHVKKWNGYWRIGGVVLKRQEGKRRKVLMQEVHGKIFQVSCVHAPGAARTWVRTRVGVLYRVSFT